MFYTRIKSYNRILLFALICIFVISGCSGGHVKKTPEQLFDECSSGVVLIYCEFYYSATLPTGQVLYFTGLDKDGNTINATMDDYVIKKNCNKLFGTGFFIDSKGHIMTNRHVVNVALNEIEAQEKIAASLRSERQTYLDSMEMARQAYMELETKKNECYVRDYYGNIYADNEMLQTITEAMSIVEARYERWQQLCNFISANINPRAIKINTFSKIGVAYNDTFVDSEEDFFGANACVVRKISHKENADLAIIQLKNKKTPEFAHVFEMSKSVDGEIETKPKGNILSRILQEGNATEGEDAEVLKMDQQLYMIGYNQGIELALTRKGIKAQMTSGRLTQLSDGERILYSIPAMHGSSGSPVIDEYGHLRGVNFAGMVSGGNFNFGIPMNLINNFLVE